MCVCACVCVCDNVYACVCRGVAKQPCLRVREQRTFLIKTKFIFKEYRITVKQIKMAIFSLNLKILYVEREKKENINGIADLGGHEYLRKGSRV